MTKVTMEQREAIVRRAVAERDAILTGRAAQRVPMPVERIAMLWNSLPLETDPQSVVAFVRAVESFHGIGTHGVGDKA